MSSGSNIINTEEVLISNHLIIRQTFINRLGNTRSQFLDWTSRTSLEEHCKYLIHYAQIEKCVFTNSG